MKLGINKVLQYYFLSYSIGAFALGFIFPFISVFALQQVIGGDAKVVGFAAGMYGISRGLAQLPGGIFLDRLRKKFKYADFYFVIFNLLVETITIFGFLFVFFPVQLYLLQGIRGSCTGFSSPAFGTVLSKYLDRGKEGMEWALQGAAGSLLFGISGAIAGLIIAQFGFSSLFIIAGSIHFAALVLGVLMYRKAAKTRAS